MSIINQLKITKFKLFDVGNALIQFEQWEGVRHPLELDLQWLDVV